MAKGRKSKFTQIQEGDFYKRLVGKLAPCVDKIRDINTKLGMRAYTVRIVKTRWSGGQRGDGVEEVVCSDSILPTPKIEAIADLDAMVTSVGVSEEGMLKVTEISMRFSEDYLAGRNPDGTALSREFNFYYEIEFTGGPGKMIRRRYTVDGTPALEPEHLHWTVKLRKAEEDRSRSGIPQG